MNSFLYFYIVGILFVLGSCGNADVSPKDVLVNKEQNISNKDSINSGIYIHSIEYRKVVDALIPSTVSVYLTGINHDSAEALYEKYDRACLKMSVNNIVGDLSFEVDGDFKKVTLYKSSPFMGMTDDEIHGLLKRAKLILTNDSMEMVIGASDKTIETTIARVREER